LWVGLGWVRNHNELAWIDLALSTAPVFDSGFVSPIPHPLRWHPATGRNHASMASTILLTNQASRALQAEEGGGALLISKIRIINTQVASVL